MKSKAFFFSFRFFYWTAVDARKLSAAKCCVEPQNIFYSPRRDGAREKKKKKKEIKRLVYQKEHTV